MSEVDNAHSSETFLPEQPHKVVSARSCHMPFAQDLSLREQFGSPAPGARNSSDDKAEVDIYLVRHLNAYALHP